MKIKLSDHFTYRRLFRFLLPSIAMMVFTSIYGVVDGFFVSNYAGKTSFAAINLIMPFLMILGGLGFMVGTGGSALVAMTLGQSDQKNANRYFTMMIQTTLILGAAAAILGYIFTPQVARLLGATEAMLPDCITYARINLLFNISYMLQNLFQSFFVTAEKPKMGLAYTLAAGFTNMIGDWLLVGVFHHGVAGAALATGLSQTVGGVLPLFYFIKENDSRLQLVKTKLEWKPVIDACSNGASELLSNIAASIVSMLYNFQLLKYLGENGVSAYGVLMYVQFIFIAIYVGYSVGSAPIVGYDYGAGNTKELQNMFRKSMILMSSAGIVMTISAYFLAEPLSAIFVSYDAELMELTTHAFHLFTFTFLLAGVNIYTSSFFTALNNGKVSAIISVLRTLVFQTSAVMIMPLILGNDGIWFSNFAAEALAFVISMYALFANRHTYHYF